MSTARSSARGNRRATRAEVRRLLTLLSLPARARRIGPVPALAEPALGTPAADSLVDLTRYRWLPRPMPAVWRYLQRHRPEGLQTAGTSRSGNVASSRPTAEGLGWSEPDRAFATELQLDVTLAPLRGGTAVRIDAVGVWLDPVPAADTAHGPRLRATLAGVCPHSDAGTVGVRNPASLRTRLGRALVPARPVRALACTYNGTNGAHPQSLRQRTSLSAPRAAALARQLRRIRLAQPQPVYVSCPAEVLANSLLVFGYRAGPDVDVWYHRSGCRWVANGVISASATVRLPRHG
jgi:hypothetical protein